MGEEEGEEVDKHSWGKKRVRRWMSTVGEEEDEEVDEHSGWKKRVRR